MSVGVPGWLGGFSRIEGLGGGGWMECSLKAGLYSSITEAGLATTPPRGWGRLIERWLLSREGITAGGGDENRETVLTEEKGLPSGSASLDDSRVWT